MREMRRVAAARNFIEDRNRVEVANVLSSYGPYKTSAGKVMGLSTRALTSDADAP